MSHGICTAGGIVVGGWLAHRVPASLARRVMLLCAWAGTVVVLVRGVMALF